MWITVDGTNATEIDDDVVKRVLSLYPEEELETRNTFVDAFANGSITLKDLRTESEKILIPWQLFLLSKGNLETQQRHIESQRKYRVSPRLLVKRKGAGKVTSKRIIDRLIRQQEFLTSQNSLPLNAFCESLRGRQAKTAARGILSHFGIDRDRLWRLPSKAAALQYLIGQVEARYINVSRGTSAHKLLPTSQVVPSNVYKSTSGFVLKDDRVPFLFLPGDLPEEVDSRQIYTLIYLVAAVGLGAYDYLLDKDFRARMISSSGVERRLHSIASEVLIPEAETEKLRGREMTPVVRDSLAEKLKVSPSALLTALRMRRLISEEEYEALKPEPFVPSRDERRHSPKVITSVEKFCGRISHNAIADAIASRTLTSTQAQYLIFGAVNRKAYHRYLTELGV